MHVEEIFKAIDITVTVHIKHIKDSSCKLNHARNINLRHHDTWSFSNKRNKHRMYMCTKCLLTQYVSNHLSI